MFTDADVHKQAFSCYVGQSSLFPAPVLTERQETVLLHRNVFGFEEVLETKPLLIKCQTKGKI